MLAAVIKSFKDKRTQSIFSSEAIGADNAAYGSMISGGSALYGKTLMRLKPKLLTTTRGTQC